MPYKDQSTLDIIAAVEALAKRKGPGVSMAQVAVAWMLAKPGVTAPIVGTTSLANLEDILGECSRHHYRDWKGWIGADGGHRAPHTVHRTPTGGLDVQLSEADIKELEEPYRPQPIMGHD